jgi:hypothetical protein
MDHVTPFIQEWLASIGEPGWNAARNLNYIALFKDDERIEYWRTARAGAQLWEATLAPPQLLDKLPVFTEDTAELHWMRIELTGVHRRNAALVEELEVAALALDQAARWLRHYNGTDSGVRTAAAADRVRAALAAK